MKGKLLKGKKSKLIALIAILAIIISALIGYVFSDTSTKYVLSITNPTAVATDKDSTGKGNVQITENAVADGSKKIKYEVKLQNIVQNNYNSNVAIVVDTSYSMQNNDGNQVLKDTVKDVATGIISEVKNSYISIINNTATKLNLSRNTTDITNAIDGLTWADGGDCNSGLELGYNNVKDADDNNTKKYIILFTDSTDDVRDTLQNIKAEHPEITIITVLTDLTSNSYLLENGNNLNNVDGIDRVFLLLSEVQETDLSENEKKLIYDKEYIYDELNKSIKDVVVTNIFSEPIRDYFDITFDNPELKSGNTTLNITDENKKPTLEITKDSNGKITGYKLKVSELKFQDELTLNYNMEFNPKTDVAVRYIFQDIDTNAKQDIEFKDYLKINQKTVNGVDSRVSADPNIINGSVQIQITKGYELEIRTVNKEDNSIILKNVECTITANKVKDDGTREPISDFGNNGSIVKKSDSYGNITFTPDDTVALREAGKVEFLVTPNVNQVGYSRTDPVSFIIDNNSEQGRLIFDSNGSIIKPTEPINETKRQVTVYMEINVETADIEVKTVELNNNNVELSNCTYELIEPKLNNNSEKKVLQSEIRADGTVHFSPTVMTQDGKYGYILQQKTTQTGYDLADLSLITIEFKNGKMVGKPTVQFNPNVNAQLIGENYCLITVANENQKQSPFDFQIKLSDLNNPNEKLGGVTYLISVTNQKNQVVKKYEKTDNNGEINTQLYGSGLLRIEVIEQAPSAGYKPETKVRTLVINRTNNNIVIMQGTNVPSGSTYLDGDTLVLDLNSEKQPQQNVIKVKLVDNLENDVGVGPNVGYYLEDLETGTIYGSPNGTPALTNRNSELKIIIDPKDQGIHRYSLQVVDTTIPREYDETYVDSSIELNLDFDSDGYLREGTNVVNNPKVIDETWTISEGQNSKDFTEEITIGYKLKESNAYNFKLRLKDRNDMSLPIQGASYDVNIEWDVQDGSGNTITRTKNIVGRKTDANGEILTRIIKAQQVRITVQEKKPSIGYTIDSSVQEIYLDFHNNGTIAIQQAPYDKGATNAAEPNQGAYNDATSNCIIFDHLNNKKTAADTYLDLSTHKLDTNKAYVNGVILHIYSPDKKIIGKDGKGFDYITKTGDNGDLGGALISYEDFINGNSQEYMKVKGLENVDGEERYDLYIEEMRTTSKETEYSYIEADGTKVYYEPKGEKTLVKLRIIFRNKDGDVTLTNVETIYGNRLVINKKFNSSLTSNTISQTQEQLGVYIGAIDVLDLYTNYDETGNLSIDLKKENVDGEKLEGAYYDIKISNPDATVVKKKVVVDNGDDSSSIELPGAYVNIGSVITLTESNKLEELPVGYGSNLYSETLEVKDITADGEIVLEQTSNSYNPSRLKLVDIGSMNIGQDSKTMRTSYECTLIDYPIDTFEFTINTIDKSTGREENVNGYEFDVRNSLGSRNTINSCGMKRIGSNVIDNYVDYELTPNANIVPDYYKALKDKITVRIYFDNSGYIDLGRTLSQADQPDPNYMTTWAIDSDALDVTGKIAIKVYVTHLGALKVNMVTKDIVTNNTIANVEYSINTSLGLSASGTNSINVNYLCDSKPIEYTIRQTSLTNKYKLLTETRTFTVNYVDCKISGNPTITSSCSKDTIQKNGDDEVTVTLYVHPKLDVKVITKNKITNNIIQNVSYSVTPSETLSGSSTLNTSSQTNEIEVGYTKENDRVDYTLTMTSIQHSYMKEKDKSFTIKYTDNIIDSTEIPTIVSDNSNDTISRTGDTEVLITIFVTPKTPFEITNLYYFDKNVKLQGANFTVTKVNSEEDDDTESITTDANGYALAYAGKLSEDEEVLYKVSETKAATGYATIDDFFIKVTYDSQNNITDAKLVDENGNTTTNRFVTASRRNTTTSELNFNTKGCVTLEVLNYPEFIFNIYDYDRRFGTPNKPKTDANGTVETPVPISGTKYKVESHYVDSQNQTIGFYGDDDITTDNNGLGVAHLNKTRDNLVVVYTITEAQEANGYQKLGKTIDIEVTFDNLGYVSNAVLKNPTDDSNVAWTDKINNITDPKEHFIVNVELQNNPVLKISIYDYDRRYGTPQNAKTDNAGTTLTPVAIAGTEYVVNSQLANSSSTTTDSNGHAIALINRTKDNDTIEYEVVENKPSNGYQTIGKTIKFKVTFDNDGFVNGVNLSDQSDGIISVVYKTDKVELSIELQNNPVLEFRITAVDSLDKTTPIESLGYQTRGKDSDGNIQTVSSATRKANLTESPETSVTDANGKTSQFLDRTIDNSNMSYAIKQVMQAIGYEWNYDEIIINTVYGANGELTDAKEDASSANYAHVTAWDAQNFTIDITLYIEEIKEFGVHLSVLDEYDKDKKIDGLEVEAFLVSNFNDYTPGDTYKLVEDNKLISGADRDENGKPDINYGEDYLTMGKYSTTSYTDENGVYYEGGETRTLRLIVKNDSANKGSNSNASYYINQNGNTLGYQKNSNAFTNAYYQTVPYQWLITVKFNDQGEIVDAGIQSGLNNHIGWLVDNRYLEVSHTRYKLNVTMKLFPLMKIDVKAIDNYIEERTEIPGGNFKISTQRYDITGTYVDEFVTAGYVGYPEYASHATSDVWVVESYDRDGNKVSGHYSGEKWIPDTLKDDGTLVTGHWSYQYWTGSGWAYPYGFHTSSSYAVNGHRYEAQNTLFVPIENNHTRKFYVFEDVEPTNYQKYNDWYSVYYCQRMIAIISIVFDENGEIDYAHSIKTYVKDNNGNYTGDFFDIYKAEGGYGYLSGCNLQEYRYEFDEDLEKRAPTVYIGYSLTTSIEITAQDDISRNPLGGLKVYPWINNTYNTVRNYEYYTGESYRITGDDGKQETKYWGAAEPNTKKTYIWGSGYFGTAFNGYLLPFDMASASIGGSGNEQDYYTKLEVSFDAEGKISSINSYGKDLWGDDNGVDVVWDATTGKIKVNMLFSRKFEVKLFKVDYYDSTINNLYASFNVISDQKLKTAISSQQTVVFGKVYKDKTVTYTLTETQAPDDYLPINDEIKIYVTFDIRGNIRRSSINSPSPYFDLNYVADNTERINKINSPDLIINIKNKHEFKINMTIVDKFYKNLKLKDVYLDGRNDSGDKVLGNPQTDANGFAEMVIGPVYSDKTVVYKISQTSTANGYYPNNTVIELEVIYNKVGKIQSYNIKSGNEVVNNFDNTSFLGQKEINMEIMNMPKDVKVGLYKYDKLTNKPIENVKFTMNKVDLASGKDLGTTEFITEADGYINAVVDEFKDSLAGKTIKYTLHEETTPNTYRIMEDVVFTIKYNPDGSIAYSNQIDNSNHIMNTDVELQVAKSGLPYVVDGEYAHMQISVPNDNAYDLIIKDEDINYSGLGVKGTEYQVSINGREYNPSQTNEYGLTSINDLTDSGEITINIAEVVAGEGYKSNINNTASIKVNKGTDVYSLKLDSNTNGYVDEANAKTTYAIIEVDEKHGEIKVTFKNETDVQFTLYKQNKFTAELLENVEFEINAEQVDNDGNSIGNPIELTNPNNYKTDVNGKLFIDIGVAPQSQIWQYKIKELSQINGYWPNDEVILTVTYDQYGKIIDRKSSDEAVLDSYLEHGDSNCRHIIVSESDYEKADADLKIMFAPNFSKLEIKAQQLDDMNNLIGSPVTLTTSDNETINQDGEWVTNLGICQPNEIWQFEVKLIPISSKVLEDLGAAAGPHIMTVKYDKFGRVLYQRSNNDETFQCRYRYNSKSNHVDLIGMIKYNGANYDENNYDENNYDEKYQIKVVKKDSYTNKRVNGAGIYLNLTDDSTGEMLEVEPATKGAMNNGETKDTGSLTIDKQIIYDEKKASSPIIENGLAYIDGLDFEGTINIDVSEKTAAEGYTFGKQDTDGNVKIKVKYVSNGTDAPKPQFTVEDNDGLAVTTDNKRGIITITLLNDSVVDFNIVTTEYTTDPKKKTVGIPGVSYDITSVISYAVSDEPTDLNQTTPISNMYGVTKATAGQAYAGNTVIYTLKQKIDEPYKAVDDIQVLIQYDSYGYIKYYELLSSEDNTRFIETYEDCRKSFEDRKDVDAKDIEDNAEYVVKPTEKRSISINVQNRGIVGDYQIILEKHMVDTEQMLEAYETLLPGAEYEISINQEFPNGDVNPTVVHGISDDKGQIRCPKLNGYGHIQIILKELNPPPGFKKDYDKTILIYRDELTGKIEKEDSDVNFGPANKDDDYNEDDDNGDWSEIWLMPVDQQAEDKFTLIINKNSTVKNKRITDDKATFDVEIEQKDDQGAITYSNKIENVETDAQGRIISKNIDIPQEAGKYTFRLIETKAPKGYKLPKDPVELELVIGKADNDVTYIESISDDTDHNVTILKKNSQLIALNVANEPDPTPGEDEYALDITKVDGETNEPIEPTALFKVWLPDKLDTAVYTETSETILGPGKLDYCYIEQDKDYSIRLTHMKKPTADDFDNLRGQQSGGTNNTISNTIDNTINGNTTNNSDLEIAHEYTFREILPPDGYSIIPEDLVLTIYFKQNAQTGEVYISRTTSSNTNYLRINSVINPGDEWPTSSPVDVDILDSLSVQKEFTVKYDANDNGENTQVPVDQEKILDQDLTLDSMSPVRDGYIFKGWGIQPDSTTATYQPGDTYNLNQDITLYAIWEEKLYVETSVYEIGEATDVDLDRGRFKYQPFDYTNTNGDKVTRYEYGQQTQTDTIYMRKILPYNQLRVVRDSRGRRIGYDFTTKRTDINMFKNNIKTNADDIQIINHDGTPLGEPTYDNAGRLAGNAIGTGMKLKLTKGNQTIEISLVVNGDISRTIGRSHIIGEGEGRMAADDKSLLNNYILYIRNANHPERRDPDARLNTIALIAADVDRTLDGRINAADISEWAAVFGGSGNRDFFKVPEEGE